MELISCVMLMAISEGIIDELFEIFEKIDDFIILRVNCKIFFVFLLQFKEQVGKYSCFL